MVQISAFGSLRQAEAHSLNFPPMLSQVVASTPRHSLNSADHCHPAFSQGDILTISSLMKTRYADIHRNVKMKRSTHARGINFFIKKEIKY